MDIIYSLQNYPDRKELHRLFERLATLGITGAPLKPLNTIFLWCSRGFRRALQLVTHDVETPVPLLWSLYFLHSVERFDATANDVTPRVSCKGVAPVLERNFQNAICVIMEDFFYESSITCVIILFVVMENFFYEIFFSMHHHFCYYGRFLLCFYLDASTFQPFRRISEEGKRTNRKGNLHLSWQ